MHFPRHLCSGQRTTGPSREREAVDLAEQRSALHQVAATPHPPPLPHERGRPPNTPTYGNNCDAMTSPSTAPHAPKKTTIPDRATDTEQSLRVPSPLGASPVLPRLFRVEIGFGARGGRTGTIGGVLRQHLPSTMNAHVIAPSSSNPLLAVTVAIFTSPVTVTSLVHGHVRLFFGGYC